MTGRADILQQRGLKLSHLRMLAALREAGQIGLAADRIGITQPAASRLLAEIERIAGIAVHERSGRGVGLTPAGEALARRALRVQIELRDAARDIAEVASGGTGHVRIGSVTGPALDRVLPVLRTLRMAEPSVTTEVVVATSDILCEQLLSGQIDFAIARLLDTAEPGILNWRMIAPEPVSLIVRSGHPLDGRRHVAPEDLLAYDWVMPGPQTLLSRTVLARLRSLGLPHPQQRLSTASFLLTLALLQQSNAIAPLARAVAESFAKKANAPYAELPVDLGIEVEPFGLITRLGAVLPPVAQRLADRIADLA